MIKDMLKSIYNYYTPEGRRIRRLTEKNEKLARGYCKRHHVPDITDAEKREVRDYWAQYGIRQKDYSWYQLYYYVTGRHDPRFVPDHISGAIITQYYNDARFTAAWADKNMFQKLLPDVPLPECLASCVRNRLKADGETYTHDESGERSVAEKIFEKLNAVPQNVIFKPSRNSGSGKGVQRYFADSVQSLEKALEEWRRCDNFIVQKCVKQHETMALLNESSNNMLRFYSWRHENEVDVLFAAARAGIPGSFKDITVVNGKEMENIVNIRKDGYFDETMYNQEGEPIRTLPKNLKVPAYEEIIDIIKKNHLQADNFDIIAWDFTVNEDSEPVCFEWNVRWPGTILYQYVNGPLWGNKTEEILAFLKDNPENQKKYIPRNMRIKNNHILSL